MTSARPTPSPGARPAARRRALLVVVAAVAATPFLPAPSAAQARALPRMPGVVGLTVDRAQATLVEAGLGQAAVRDTLVPGIPAGIVVRQDPPADAVLRTRPAVTLWATVGPTVTTFPSGPLLSTGDFQARRSMPRVVGMPAPDARVALERLGLRVTEESVVVQGGDGTVVRQLPEAGTPVQPGNAAHLVVARPAPTPEPMVSMPLVVGRILGDALAILAESKLQGSAEEVVSSAVPGTVLRQLPQAGTPLAPGSVARLVVAREAPRPTVPGVVGLLLEAAAGTLRGAGFPVGAVTRVASDTPAGTVVEQKPAGGQAVAAGTGVDLAVSEGPRARVPDVRGMAEERARDVLARVGLGVEGVTSVPSPAPPGEVVAQSPAPGTALPAGSAVDLAVAAPLPEPEGVEVPAVVGALRDGAEARIREAGLTPGPVEAVPSEAPEGTVLDQWPPAGTLVAPGESVRLGLAVPVERAEPPPVVVPDVVGLEAGPARAALAGVGLATVEVRGDGASVTDQFPAAGTAVAPGTPVLLTLQAQAPPPALPEWVSRWRGWGVPVGAVVLLLLLRVRRAPGRKGGGAPRTDPPLDGPGGPGAALEYRLKPTAPRGSVEVVGPLLPPFEITLRPRPPRTVRAELRLGGAGAVRRAAPGGRGA